MIVLRFGDLTGAERADARAALERIFFAASSRQSFADDAARAAFLARWTGWYLQQAASDTLLWRENGDWLGYLTGCRDSAAATQLFATIPLYDRFADLFGRFPAHLHVNVAESARSRGVGAALVNAFAADCPGGVHIVTGAGARNAAFYRRCGFTFEQLRDGLLFMGRE